MSEAIFNNVPRIPSISVSTLLFTAKSQNLIVCLNTLVFGVATVCLWLHCQLQNK